MPTDIKAAVRRLIRKFGLDLHRYNPEADPVLRRQRLLAHCGIDLVLDVGANAGQFGVELRRGGYRGRIVSFEPLSSAFRQLAARAEHDAAWSTMNTALSDADGTATINVSGNSVSSSLLAMLPTHGESAPESGYVGKETIGIRRLDGLFAGLAGPAARVYLKIDTQGSELRVLQGAGATLEDIDLLELELSLVPLYEGGPLLPEMLAWLAQRDYILVGLEPGFSDPRSGRLLQVDGIFARGRLPQLQ